MTEQRQPPEVIWLQYYGDPFYWDTPGVPQRDEETTWSSERVHDSDVRYVRADVAEEQIKAADRAAREECAGICGHIARTQEDELHRIAAQFCEDRIRETMK